ncbi:MAG TPA: porin family protein [Gemmatimonadales bacterium]|nr:porin family protein [Gemmatimonadales bacterium]
MRKQVVLGMLAVLAGSTLASKAVSAQEQSGTSTQFSLGGGIDIPLGDFDNAAKTGWHGLAAVTFTPATWPVGIQIDGDYGRFPDDSPADVNLQMIYGTGNLVYRFQTSPESTFRPYLIGGGGVYNLKQTGNDVPSGFDDSTTKFGLNGGAGFDIKAGSASLFAEARFHNVFTEGSNTNFLPITVGVRFGG